MVIEKLQSQAAAGVKTTSSFPSSAVHLSLRVTRCNQRERAMESLLQTRVFTR